MWGDVEKTHYDEFKIKRDEPSEKDKWFTLNGVKQKALKHDFKKSVKGFKPKKKVKIRGRIK